MTNWPSSRPRSLAHARAAHYVPGMGFRSTIWLVAVFLIGCSHVITARFSGTVTTIDCGCWSDGVCSIAVNGKMILFGRGWSGSTWGAIEGLRGCEESVGMSAEVFARKDLGASFGLPDTYSLEGSQDYYVRLRPPARNQAKR